ncbi:MAG: carboxypeptidase-like regulatory domain-containing protein [Gemmatimonadaceae bacterium]
MRAALAFITRLASVALLLAFPVASAQAQAGVIRGVVTDTGGRPLRGVEVLSINSQRSTRTDAEGRYVLSRLPWGTQLVMARLPGYRAGEKSVALLDETTPVIDFKLHRLVPLLDTVRITSHDGCAAYDIAGFECRRRAGIGQFRGAEEIGALRPRYWADMFEGLAGLRRTPFMNTVTKERDWTVESNTGWRCLMEGWNGRDKTAADEVTLPRDIVAIEHYDLYEKVPAAYKRLAWPSGQGKPCALVMYWTRGFVENERKR